MRPWLVLWPLLALCHCPWRAAVDERLRRLEEQQATQAALQSRRHEEFIKAVQRLSCPAEALSYLASFPELTQPAPTSCRVGDHEKGAQLVRRLSAIPHVALYFKRGALGQIGAARRGRLRELTQPPYLETTVFLVLGQPFSGVADPEVDAEARGRQLINDLLLDDMKVPAELILGPRTLPFCGSRRALREQALPEDIPRPMELQEPQLGTWVFRLDCLNLAGHKLKG